MANSWALDLIVIWCVQGKSLHVFYFIAVIAGPMLSFLE
jgi:hypothetical protein